MAYTHSFDDVIPPARFDAVAWTRARVEEAATEGGIYTEVAALAVPVDATPETPDAVDLTVTTATLERGWYRFRFDTGASSPPSPYTDAIFSPGAPTGAFATRDDVEARLGRELTAGEQQSADLLLAAATSLIAAFVGRDDQWAAELAPVPSQLRFVCVEMVVRSLSNTGGVASYSETLGTYSYSESFGHDNYGLMLSTAEELLLRRVVYGSNSASVPIGSHFREVEDA